MEKKFCQECGTRIPEGAAYCPSCGIEILEEESVINAKAADFSESRDYSLKEIWSKSGDLQKLFSFLWLELILAALSWLVGFFDVREYYYVGRTWHFISAVAFLALGVWLIRAMMERKSWARKIYILLTVLDGASLVLGGIEMSFSTVLNLGSLLVSGYCVYLCFTKEVSDNFQTPRSSSARSVNWQQGFTYVVAFCLLLGIVFWRISYYYGTDEWGEDCAEAMLAGSVSARDDMINIYAEAYAENGSEDPIAEATRDIDDFIRENKSNNNSNSNSTSIQSRERTRQLIKAGGIAASKAGVGKGIGKVIILAIGGLFAFAGKYILKRKDS